MRQRLSSRLGVALVLGLVACGQPGPSETALAATPPETPAPEPVTPTPVVPAGAPVARDVALDDAARLLGGLPLASGSSLATVATDPAYVAYATRTETLWTDYEKLNGAGLRTWTSTELADVPAGPVFYPFAGPDALNALLLFPKGTTYVLLGLEPVGALPVAGEPAATTLARTTRVERAVGPMLNRNYFITDRMSEQLDDSVGVAAVALYFLARTGHEIVDARLITLDATGGVVPSGAASDTAAKGVEIHFRSGDGAVRSFRYFSSNIEDYYFKQTVGLREHIVGLGPMSTMVKAASYLMYLRSFDDVRAIVLARSTHVVSENSGVPFHYLNRPGWALSLYGTYDAPIKEFAERCEPDLQKALAETSKGTLPFAYGYNYKTGNHIVIARRAADSPVVTPVFDGVNRIGEESICGSGKVNVVKL